MEYILLVAGFVLLVKGADIFVDGSVAIAQYFRIPSLIIGLTIVAFGTSAPEAAVSITAAVTGQNGIAVGNVIGSNLFNLLMVLGACALIKPCPVEPSVLRSEYPLSIIAVIAFIVLTLTGLGGSEPLLLSRIDGVILLGLFAFFLISTIRKALRHPVANDVSCKRISLPKGLLLSLAGLTGIIVGGQAVVNSASAIAASFGVSQTLIGLTIVAVGTSLPELVTSIAAALKGQTDIAVGNVIGSNLFNLLFVLSISVTIHPITVEWISIYDGIILIAVSLLVLFPAVSRKEIRRGWGFLFIVLYAVYNYYIIIR